MIPLFVPGATSCLFFISLSHFRKSHINQYQDNNPCANQEKYWTCVKFWKYHRVQGTIPKGVQHYRYGKQSKKLGIAKDGSVDRFAHSLGRDDHSCSRYSCPDHMTTRRQETAQKYVAQHTVESTRKKYLECISSRLKGCESCTHTRSDEQGAQNRGMFDAFQEEVHDDGFACFLYKTYNGCLYIV